MRKSYHHKYLKGRGTSITEPLSDNPWKDNLWDEILTDKWRRWLFFFNWLFRKSHSTEQRLEFWEAVWFTRQKYRPKVICMKCEKYRHKDIFLVCYMCGKHPSKRNMCWQQWWTI